MQNIDRVEILFYCIKIADILKHFQPILLFVTVLYQEVFLYY